jgi:hypothetical protein
MSKNKTTKRFTSEKSANDFAGRVGGSVSDLRGYESRKSDFKVSYTRKTYRSSDSSLNESDFDSDINFNGMRWHTSDDL